MSDSTAPQRRRVFIACLNCRKRKIKCMTDDTEQQPCDRCIRKGLLCEYLAVGDEDSTSARDPPPGRSSAGQSPSSSSYPAGSYPVSSTNSNGAYGTHPPPHAIHPQYAPSQPQEPHSNHSAHQYQGHRTPAPYPVPSSQYNNGPSNTYGREQPPMHSPFPPPNQAGPSTYPPNYGYYPYASSQLQPQRCTCLPGPCYCGTRRV
ncbi:hypothetical protein C8R43DRAFT_1244276 [Mycena crocata]|nr:hypothetical protein C8R43DRAFT_1244276 [Mycena crocata]